MPHRRRPNLNFVEMGIPLGATLAAVKTDETATVTAERRVRFRGTDMPLSQATRLTLNVEYRVNPTPHWTYKGQSLQALYLATYGA